jgi:hypothetical protein
LHPTTNRIATTALTVFIGAGSALAHHSAVLFDLSKTFTFAGTLTRIDWRNPHVEVFLDTKPDGGTAELWELETGAPAWFRNRTLAKSDLDRAMGTVVTVEGVRAKDGSHYGYLYAITFADGTRWDLR